MGLSPAISLRHAVSGTRGVYGELAPADTFLRECHVTINQKKKKTTQTRKQTKEGEERHG